MNNAKLPTRATWRMTAVLASAFSLVLACGLQPRSAAAANVELLINEILIAGFGSFRGGGAPFAFGFNVGGRATELNVNQSVAPAGFPVPLYRIEARTIVSVDGGSINVRFTFDDKCLIAGVGCGPSQLFTTVAGSLFLPPGQELKGAEFLWGDYTYNGDNAPLQVSLFGEINIDFADNATPDIVFTTSHQAEVSNAPFPTVVDNVNFGGLSAGAFLASVGFSTDPSATLPANASLISGNTFEIKIITGPVPLPPGIVLLGGALLLLQRIRGPLNRDTIARGTVGM